MGGIVGHPFLLGDQAPTSARYYPMEAGKPDVYIVHASVGTSFTVTRRQMHTAQLPRLTVEYQLNTIRAEERIEYLPYDADHYAVRRNGMCLFYILKTRVDMITQAVQAYENGTFDPKAFGV